MARGDKVRRQQPQGGAYGAGTRIKDAVVRGADRGSPVAQVLNLSNPATLAPALLAATLGNQQTRVAARDFYDGLAGNPKGGAAVTVAPRAATAVTPAAKAAAGADPVATPQQLMLAHLDSLLRGPVTLREMQAASGMMPAPAKVDLKDQAVEGTIGVATSLFDAQMRQIEKARAENKMTLEEAQDATAKATDAYFLKRVAAIGNPLSYAQANMLPSPDDKE